MRCSAVSHPMTPEDAGSRSGPHGTGPDGSVTSGPLYPSSVPCLVLGTEGRMPDTHSPLSHGRLSGLTGGGAMTAPPSAVTG